MIVAVVQMLLDTTSISFCVLMDTKVSVFAAVVVGSIIWNSTCSRGKRLMVILRGGFLFLFLQGPASLDSSLLEPLFPSLFSAFWYSPNTFWHKMSHHSYQKCYSKVTIKYAYYRCAYNCRCLRNSATGFCFTVLYGRMWTLVSSNLKR